mgnify:CR=1 FL=1
MKKQNLKKKQLKYDFSIVEIKIFVKQKQERQDTMDLRKNKEVHKYHTKTK